MLRVARRLQLRQELARAHDRAGDEVREEAQVERDVDRAGRLDQAPLDVDDVGDRLEGEEADADRQRDRQQRQRQPEADAVEHVVDVLGEEAVVLEDAEDEQVERDRDADDPLARGARPRVRPISFAATWLPSVTPPSSRQNCGFAAA